MKIQSIGIVTKTSSPHAPGTMSALVPWLVERGVSVRVQEDYLHLAREGAMVVGLGEVLREVQVALVLGGDGTFLSAARMVEGPDPLLLGVNLGSLGFLTELSLDEMFVQLPGILEGEFRIEERARLEVVHLNGPETLGHYQVLNDAVVHKGNLARLIDLETTIDGQRTTTFRGDGLIISTPTGSTGYSLAAGGPILEPTLDAVVITPMCPQCLSERSLVVRPEREIQVRMVGDHGDVFLTLDGQSGLELQKGDQIRVRISPDPVRFIRTGIRTFYEVLGTKLAWGRR